MISFQIYADDILLYDSGLIGRDTYPVDFDVDINFAESIRIQSYSDDYTFIDDLLLKKLPSKVVLLDVIEVLLFKVLI